VFDAVGVVVVNRGGSGRCLVVVMKVVVEEGDAAVPTAGRVSKRVFRQLQQQTRRSGDDGGRGW
jgi:hypothetical protein